MPYGKEEKINLPFTALILIHLAKVALTAFRFPRFQVLLLNA